MASSTKPKERPILFKGPLVRAILEGRKTVTRRPVRCDCVHRGRLTYDEHGSRKWWHQGTGIQHACPYGVQGDRLWVRETWRVWDCLRGATEGDVVRGKLRYPMPEYVEWRADCDDPNYCEDPWRPSIFMPRWACRLLLEVTEVRVERLQEITPEEVHAEGIPGMVCGRYQCRYCNGQGHNLSYPICTNCKGTGDDELGHWQRGWDDINGKREGCTWEDNPWVWVVRFKRLEAPNE